jgi:hypothetical protein
VTAPAIEFAGYTCVIDVLQYRNGRVALRLVDAYGGAPVATATVNLPDEVMEPGEVAIKDYSENEGMLATLVAAGIVGEPVRTVSSGWVTVPICPLLTEVEP